MQERAELLGGTFGMASDRNGTTITITLPCRKIQSKEGQHDTR
jgi:signal transduction histidine kinase